MKKLLALIIALSFPINSFAAECQVPVKLLEEGSPAPCKGYLFSLDKELDVRVKIRDYSLIKEEVNVLNQMLDRLQKREVESEKILQLEQQKTELWKTRAEDATLKLVSIQETQNKRDLTLILVGVGLTVLAGWSMGQVAGK